MPDYKISYFEGATLMRQLNDLLFLLFFVALLFAWFFAWLVMHIASGAIHILLGLAVVSLVIHLFGRKDRA